MGTGFPQLPAKTSKRRKVQGTTRRKVRFKDPVQQPGGGHNLQQSFFLVVRQSPESRYRLRAEGPLIPVPIQFPQMGVENARSPPFHQTIQKSWSEDLLDFIPAISHPDPAPGGIAPDEFLDRLPVPKGSRPDLPVAGMKAVFPVSAASEQLFGGFRGESFGGSQRMPSLRNPPQA